MKYIVYLTTNKKNNKIYIGVHGTVDPEVFDGYLGCGIKINCPSSYKKSKTPMQYAVNKYGTDSFVRTTLKVFDTPEEAYEMEAQIVDHEFLKRNDVYNVALGGGLPQPITVNAYQYNFDGTFVKKWESIMSAADFFKCSPNAISNAIVFNSTSQEYLWSYDFVDKLDISKYTIHTNKQLVYKYNEDGELVKIYNSIIDASEDMKCKSSTIGRAIKGMYKVNGFNFSLEKFDKFENPERIFIRNAKMHFYTLDGEYYKTFNNTTEVKKEFGLKTTNVISVAIKTKREFHGYQISLERLDRMNPIKGNGNAAKRVGQYDFKGNLIKEFRTITEAIDEFGTGVQRVIRGQRKMCKGFSFKFLD